MTVGLVLSGGGAKGSFQAGALVRLYEEGFFAQVISGTSVGAINAVKLAEGGTPEAQKTACGQLATIWRSLTHEGDMLEETEWYKKAQVIIQDESWNDLLADVEALSHAGEPLWELATLPLHRLRDHHFTSVFDTPTLAAQAWDVTAQVLSMAERHGQNATDIIEALEKSVSMMMLAPIEARLRGGDISPAAVAASGVRLRLAMISLESGEIRYVAEDGSVLDEKQNQHFEPPAELPAACKPIDIKLKAAIAERGKRYREELKQNLDSGMMHRHAVQAALLEMRRFDEDTAKLSAQLAECRANNSSPAPLKSDVIVGTLASASIPAAFPPVRIGLDHYVDGGVRENVPYAGAQGAGANHHVVISASPSGAAWHRWAMPQTWPLVSVALRGLDLALTEIALTDVPDDAGAIHIFPSFEVHGMLQVEKGLIRINMEYGYMRAADALARARYDKPRIDPLTGMRKHSTAADFTGISPPVVQTGPRLDTRVPDVWLLTADAITALRIVAWKLEISLDAARRAKQTVLAESAHGVIRTVKRVIRTCVENREIAGAPTLASAAVLPDAWYGAWEFHSDFALQGHPFARPGGGFTYEDSALQYVRDHDGRTYYIDGGRRREMSPAAIAARGADAQQAPTVAGNILRCLVPGAAVIA